MAIESVASGVPTGTLLSSATVAEADVAADGSSQIVSIPLPARLVTAGTQYAIVLAAPRAVNDSAWMWRTSRSGALPSASLGRKSGR